MLSKPKPKLIGVLALLYLLLISSQTFSQTVPGFINRQATSVGGRAILDPNGDGYTSATTAGFGNDDVVNAELLYTAIKAYPIEPFGDLARGSNHNYSDFVPDTSGSGVYYRFSATQQVMFRIRVGSVIPGSKGYSILMDTDGKFGATGANADPNYLPATTGINGNPGFEIEVVLETNSRIAIYNVDGTTSPVLVKQYTNWQDMSQVSVASTNDNGDPDFLIDFYIPFSDLQAAPFNLTAASTIRMTATTVMSPQAAIGGPRSDIYGVAGNTYEDYILGQPACTVFTTPATCPTAMCTASPVVNSPIGTGTVNITGSWTKSALSGAVGTATITVYKNGVSVGTVTNVSSGATWTLNSISLVNGDVITAKAQATAESMCLTSNAVAASTCNASNIPATPVLTCTSGSKGVGGANLSTGWTVHVDNLTRNVLDNSITNASGLFGANTGTTPNITWIYSGGCSSGAPLTSGSYKIYYTDNVTGCNSQPAYFCAAGNGGTALAGSLAVPAITAPANAVFTTATKTISGTTDATAVVYLYINGINVQNTTATAGGSFSFSGLNLLAGQQLYLVAELNTGTVSTSKCESQTIVYTVSCYTLAPLMSADNNSQITAGAPITGTSTEAAGTTIRVYTSTNTLVATTTVQANGTWSTGNAGTTPATYNAVAATSYYANAQNGSCGVSTNSATYAATTATTAARCGSITGPVTSGVPSISGTLTGSFTTTTVNLYLDGELIGSTTTNNTTWGPITVNTLPTNTLYPNGILKIGVQESSKQEVACPASALAIVCTPAPTIPIYSLSSSNVNQYQPISATITNAATGTFYALADSATGQSFGQGKWATAPGTLILNTDAFNAAGTYKIKIGATSMSGVTLCSAVSPTTTLVVNPITLPLYLIQFSGKKETTDNLLEWITENEISLNRFEIERSVTGTGFTVIASKSATNSSTKTYYSFADITAAAGTNYYRLKMIDNDGKFTYSNTIVISSTRNGDITIGNVAPNPFTEKINLTITLSKTTPFQLQVIDFSGRLCSTKNIEGKKGINNIEVTGLGKLSQGMYYIRISTPDVVLQQKVLKVE